MKICETFAFRQIKQKKNIYLDTLTNHAKISLYQI